MSIEGNVESTEKVLKGKVIGIPEIDKTLTKEGYSADAKAVGDKLDVLTEKVGNVTTPKADVIPYGDTTVKEALDNAFMKSEGGIIDGVVMMRNADNGYGSVMKNNSSTADYGTQLADTSASGNVAKITVNANANLLTYTGADGNIRDIHHEGNKRFGNYTGNGDATSREIDTKSIGRLLLVYNGLSFAFVTPEGALAIDLTNREFEWISNTKVFYVNGKMTLLTNDDALNKADTNYYYQAI